MFVTRLIKGKKKMVEVAREIEIILLSSKQQNLFEFGACFYLRGNFKSHSKNGKDAIRKELQRVV